MTEKTDKEKIQEAKAKLEALSVQVDSLSANVKQTSEFIERKRFEIKTKQGV